LEEEVATPKVVNWAHRGASGHAPENTRAAFEAALALGADGIECDIRESRDGALLVFHDATLKRVTGRRDRVDRLSLAQLRQVDVGAAFSGPFSTIPTPAEVIARLPAPFRINLEIKAPAAEKVVRLIQETQILDRVLVSSFDHPLLEQIRNLHATLPIGVLMHRESWRRVMGIASRLNAVSLHVPRGRVTPRWVAVAHAAGYQVHVYTVDEPDQMGVIMRMGVDGIFTNYPDRLYALQQHSRIAQ
jgi:glycerophosphoryl diester phosphodiesterase